MGIKVREVKKPEKVVILVILFIYIDYIILL